MRQICPLRHLVKRGKAFSYDIQREFHGEFYYYQRQINSCGIFSTDPARTHTTHVLHVGLSTSINDILFNYVCVWSTDDSIKNRAVTSQRDQSYIYNADAVTSSLRPVDHTIGEQLVVIFSIWHFCQWSGYS